MRSQWLARVALAGVAALTLTGCGLPAGVDGDLVDDWATIAEPVGFVPEAGTCHRALKEVGYLYDYEPVDCTTSHMTETVHVADFTAAEADQATPPSSGSPAMLVARADCEKRVNDLLGAPWRSGPMSVLVVLPSPDAWDGGARWYRCDVGQIRGLEDPGVLLRTGSLKGALGESSDLPYRCFQPTVVKDEITEMTPVACTAKHRAEFVGIWTAPASSYSAFQKDDDGQFRACRTLVATFAKVPDDGNLRYRVGTITYRPSESEWENGSRGVQCFLWMSGKEMTRSMKGAGTKGLPINYA